MAARAGYTPYPVSPAEFPSAYVGNGRQGYFYAPRASYVSAATAGGGAGAVAPPKVLLDAGGLAIDPLNPSFMVPLI